MGPRSRRDLGLDAGSLISLSDGNGQKDDADRVVPEVNGPPLSGLYVRLTIGGGGFLYSRD